MPIHLTLLYVGAVVGGVGAGIIYGASVGNALKWFPDRRGLAAGLTAAGFGAGSALTIVPIANLIKSDGYEVAFLWFGLGQGLIVMLVALLLRAPEAGEVPVPATPAVQQTRRDYGPREVLKTPVFWVMYLMFVLVGAGGLMATAQLAPIAKDFRVDNIPVSILGLTLPALTFALSIDRVLNGICRPFFGWVSDQIGRENTMFIAFLLEGIGIYALLLFAANPVWFVFAIGRGVLRLGGDLLVVPGDLHRLVRTPIRHHELRHALHREGHCIATGAARQCPHYGDRQLARGIYHSSDHEHYRRSYGTAGVKADAHQNNGERLIAMAIVEVPDDRKAECFAQEGAQNRLYYCQRESS